MLFSISSILLFFITLIDTSTTFKGAVNGLSLWFNTVLPTLFPFMILSSLIIKSNALYYLGDLFGFIVQKIFHVSKYGSFSVIGGLLCGFPMGAKITSDLVKDNKISLSEGMYLLTFTNNTSPAFILNYIGICLLNNRNTSISLLLIMYMSAYITSLLFRNTIKSKNNNKKDTIFSITNIIEQSVTQSIENILQIGGYIIIFSVLLMQCSVHIQSKIIQILSGFLEITNGIPLIIKEIPYINLQYVILSMLISFGGICSLLQTNSMIKNSGLNLKQYIQAKLIQTLFAGLLSILWSFHLF